MLPALCTRNQLPGFAVFFALLLGATTLFAQREQGQNAATACSGCHLSQTQTQPRTPMAHALQPFASNPVLGAHPKLMFAKFGYKYLVETKDGQSTYSVSDRTRTISLPIRWSFGDAAQTWLLERDGVYYESLVSYYPSAGGLEITIGDSDITPASLDEAVGRKLPRSEQIACFGCHATGAITKGQMTLSSLEPGVTCEHCHAGTTAHLIAAAQGQAWETIPPDLRKLTSEDLSNFCGQCHRSWETVIRGPWRGEINVRFQPYRLANSKCFSGTDPRISCIACHDPHKDLVTNTAAYDTKCLACHALQGTGVGNGKKSGKVCPVQKNNCASCHMPEVKVANGRTSFHDHLIRIVKGPSYPD